MANCPKCNKEVFVDKSGNFYYCRHCVSMGSFDDNRKNKATNE